MRGLYRLIRKQDASTDPGSGPAPPPGEENTDERPTASTRRWPSSSAAGSPRPRLSPSTMAEPPYDSEFEISANITSSRDPSPRLDSEWRASSFSWDPPALERHVGPTGCRILKTCFVWRYMLLKILQLSASAHLEPPRATRHARSQLVERPRPARAPRPLHCHPRGTRTGCRSTTMINFDS